MKLSSLANVALFVAAAWGRTIVIPNTVYNGPVKSETTSVPGGLDGQKVLPRPNATSFDWWYFDAVSTSSANETVAVVFYAAGPDSIGVPIPSLLYVALQGSFKNGSLFQFFLPVSPSSNATLTDTPAGLSAVWGDTGFSFAGTALDRPSTTYTVTIAAPAIGVSGTLTLHAPSPAHYPCGPNAPGQPEAVLPHVGWANALPDARAEARFTVGGTPVRFDGRGYHDKNWADMPLAAAAQNWYWGHVRAGPYAAVWFDAVSRVDGKEHVAGYVAKDGEIVEASCKPGAVRVRPWGRNSEYPPTPETGTPDGSVATFDLGRAGKLVVNVTNELVVFDNPTGVYQRYIGKAVGSIQGGPSYTGKALWEQFKFPL